jgi:hypothetical protein
MIAHGSWVGICAKGVVVVVYLTVVGECWANQYLENSLVPQASEVPVAAA